MTHKFNYVHDSEYIIGLAAVMWDVNKAYSLQNDANACVQRKGD